FRHKLPASDCRSHKHAPEAHGGIARRSNRVIASRSRSSRNSKSRISNFKTSTNIKIPMLKRLTSEMTKEQKFSDALAVQVERRIFLVRGQKVMLDADLAMLYGVEPRGLNQAVARKRKRFPADFVFQLSAREYDALTSQIVISDKDDAGAASA